MNSKSLPLVLSVAVVVFCSMRCANDNAPRSVATEPARSGSATNRAEGNTKEVHELELRYAKIFGRLTEINLESVAELNNKVPNSVSKTTMDRITHIVKLARDRRDALEAGAPPE